MYEEYMKSFCFQGGMNLLQGTSNYELVKQEPGNRSPVTYKCSPDEKLKKYKHS